MEKGGKPSTLCPLILDFDFENNPVMLISDARAQFPVVVITLVKCQYDPQSK